MAKTHYRDNRHVHILAEASAALLVADNPHAVLEPLLKAAASDVGFDQSYSYEVLPDGAHLKLVFAFGVSEAARQGLQYAPLDGPLCGIIAETAERLVLEDLQSTTEERLAPGRAAGLQAFAGFPVMVDGKLANIISFGSTFKRAFDADTIALFETIVHFVESVRERQLREGRLRDEERRYRTLFDTIDEGFCIIEFIDGPHGPLSDYVHVEANAAYALNAGIANVVGQKLREMVGDEADAWVERYGTVLRTGEPIRFEQELVKTGRYLELAAFRVEPASKRQVAVLFKDVTARRKAELDLTRLNDTLESRVAEAINERMQAEDALRQAQKMEAVGQLTGGLAHDFNNLLAGISGAFEMIGVRLSQGRARDVEKYLAAGQGATRRAAALTHRLLAFSRRQTLSPKAVVINRMMTDVVELVRRTVGPAIQVETIAASGLWPCMVDPNQLENALLNLCINARDAMPDGGRITLETGNKWLDDRTAKEHGLRPGQYVTVCVSDTGAGIAKDILDRVFDPFFTTKPMGEGTGLGLSMVYGFARQSHGHVRIYSEVDQGTMVCIYLPRHLGEADEEDEAAPAALPMAAQSGETVLVVDDEPTVRMLITDALSDAGYACVDAGDGISGLKVLESRPRIDLLITDVGLPGGLNGRQVADAAREKCPGLKVLFITGYAENAVLNHGHIAHGMEVLTKPFAVEELVVRVERMLHGPKAAKRGSA